MFFFIFWFHSLNFLVSECFLVVTKMWSICLLDFIRQVFLWFHALMGYFHFVLLSTGPFGQFLWTHDFSFIWVNAICTVNVQNGKKKWTYYINNVLKTKQPIKVTKMLRRVTQILNIVQILKQRSFTGIYIRMWSSFSYLQSSSYLKTKYRWLKPCLLENCMTRYHSTYKL